MSLPAVVRRPVREEDRSFLREVYASTRAHEMAVVPWTDAQKEEFLASQFDAQDRHYREHFPDCAFDVLWVGDERIGRLYVDRREDELRVVDIALLPAWRGRGLGRVLMQEVLDEAGRSGLPVRIHVERGNPAMHLYTRLGFHSIGGTPIYDLMEWTPT